MRKLPLIRPGFDVFLQDGGDAFGAVRQVSGIERPPVLIVGVENGGDFRVPLSAVEKVSNGKVVVNWHALEPELQRALEHTLDVEDFPPADQGEVELVGGAEEGEDADESYAPDWEPPRNVIE